ncbi:hypothetical protein [Saccharopolyspora sp. NPDC002376]
MDEKSKLLDQPVFESPRAIREFCENGRKVLRQAYLHLALSAEELQAVLKDHPTNGSPVFMGLDARVRARLVASHLGRAAQGIEVASVEMTRTFTSYHKHFLQQFETNKGSRRRPFNVNDQ